MTPRPVAALCLVFAIPLAGCAGLALPGRDAGAAAAPAVAVVENSGAARPRPRPVAAAVPPAGAATGAPGTTGSAAPAPAGGRRLGSAIVSLGAPAQPGFWLSTPLVTAAGRGRVVLVATGAAVLVDLIPSPAGTSHLSLPAFRRLGLPLTALPEVEVYAF